MSEGSEEARIIAAKSRITKFTLENKHLKTMIERLKKEIRIAEANKEKLLSDFQNSTLPEIEEDKGNNLNTQGSEQYLAMDKSPVNVSDTGDSIVSSTDSEVSLSESTSSEDSSLTNLTKNSKETQSIDSSQNVLFTTCVDSLLSNLEVVKECLRTNHCLDCTQLRNGINSMRETNFDRRHILNSNPLNNISTTFYYIFSFMSLPFIIIFLCGYFGTLVYAKQANSYLFSTPPQ